MVGMSVDKTLERVEKEKDAGSRRRSQTFIHRMPSNMHEALVRYAIKKGYPTLTGLVLEALREFAVKRGIQIQPTGYKPVSSPAPTARKLSLQAPPASQDTQQPHL